MTPLTLVHALAVGTLLTGAAMLAEAALRTRLRPARWVWGFALLVTATAPAWGPRVAGLAGDRTGAAGDLVVLNAAGAGDGAVGAAGDGAAHGLFGSLAAALSQPDARLSWAWWVLSALGIGVVALTLARLHARVARLPRARLGGDDVRLAPDFGPACVGLTDPRIVLPRWILALDRTELDLVLRHERAHGDARDPLLLAAGLLGVAAAPWNPLLWWQLVRLRRAVELDCDARVLASGATPTAYGRVLVRVLSRVRTGPFPAPALLDPVTFLERRLSLMRRSRPGSWTRSLGAAALACGLAVLACETPAPSPVEPAAPVDRADAPPPPTDEIATELASTLQVKGLGALPADATVVVDGVIVRGANLEALELPVQDIASIEIVKGGEAPVVTILTKAAAAAEPADPPPPPTAAPAEPAPATSFQLRLDRTDGASPLIYLDGERIEGGLPAVQELVRGNPDAIESIEVIKGEAARAIVGDDARHGVIRITTKKAGGGAN